jgi:hypothetical protein
VTRMLAAWVSWRAKGGGEGRQQAADELAAWWGAVTRRRLPS